MSLEFAWLRDTGVRHTDVQEIRLHRAAPCNVLLFHGLTGAPIELAYIAHHLHARSRLSVDCPALVNHGQPIVLLAHTSWHELCDSARSLFLQAQQQAASDGVPLFVGGLSIGAVLALMVAAEFPDKVAGVACLSPTFFFDGWSVPWYQRLLALANHLPLMHNLYVRTGEPYGLKDEALRAKMRDKYQAVCLTKIEHPQGTYAHFPVALLCEMRHLIAHCKRMLPRVRSPVLVVQSAQDDTSSPVNARYVLDHVGSARKELLTLHNSYHIVTADLERAKVADAMAEFFLDIVGTKAPRAQA